MKLSCVIQYGWTYLNFLYNGFYITSWEFLFFLIQKVDIFSVRLNTQDSLQQGNEKFTLKLCIKQGF